MLVFPRRPLIWLPGDPLDSQGPLAQGLVGYWACNEGGGTNIADLTGRSPGTFSGTTPTWEQSPYGPAIKLDGSTNWVNIPFATGSAWNVALPITLSLWIYWRAASASYNALIDSSGAAGAGWTFFLKSNQFPAIYDNGTGDDPIVSTAFPFNQWIHLVLTAIPTPTNLVTVYQNGVALGSSSGASMAANLPNVDLLLGKTRDFGGRFFNGSMRDVGIWNRALAPAEVLSLYTLASGAMLRARKKLWPRTAGGAALNITGATGIVSAEAFGSTAGSVANAQTINGAAGIPSAEKFGCASGAVNILGTQALTGCSGGIPSAEAFGSGGALAVAPNLTGNIGIPSAEAFGSGGTVAPGLAIFAASGGIPSAEAFGTTGAVLLAKPWTLFIAGVDRTAYLKVTTMDITKPTNGRATGRFTLFDPAGSYTPPVGAEVVFYKGTARLFGGTLEETDLTNWIGLPANSIACLCSDFGGILDRRFVGDYLTEFQGGILSLTVKRIVDGFLSADGITYEFTGDPGTDLGIQLFDWITATEAFNQITAKTGWNWNIDAYKVLRFYSPSTGRGAAPFSLADDDHNWRLMTVRKSRSKYRNRQGVRPSLQMFNLWVDVFSASIPGPYRGSPQQPDGVTRSFFTYFAPSSTPIVIVNSGLPQKVVALADVSLPTSVGWQWYWIPGGYGVFQNPANPALLPGDMLTVEYASPVPPIIWVQDSAQIAARAAIEHNSGVYEEVEEARDITDPVAAEQLAAGLLARYSAGGIPTEVIFETDRDGLEPGQLLAINTTRPAVVGSFLITNVQAREQDKQYMRYNITCSNAGDLGDWKKFYADLIQRGKQSAPKAQEIAVFPIAPSVPGVPNPGTGIPSPYSYIVRNKGVLRDITLYFREMPRQPMNFNALLNGNGIGNSAGWVYPQDPLTGAPSPTVTYFNFDGTPPLQVNRGDVLQPYIGSPGSVPYPGRDGLMMIVIDI
jgi:hypothetical protein